MLSALNKFWPSDVSPIHDDLSQPYISILPLDQLITSAESSQSSIPKPFLSINALPPIRIFHHNR